MRAEKRKKLQMQADKLAFSSSILHWLRRPIFQWFKFLISVFTDWQWAHTFAVQQVRNVLLSTPISGLNYVLKAFVLSVLFTDAEMNMLRSNACLWTIGRFDKYLYPHSHLNPENSFEWLFTIGFTLDSGKLHPACCLCIFHRMTRSSRVRDSNFLARAKNQKLYAPKINQKTHIMKSNITCTRRQQVLKLWSPSYLTYMNPENRCLISTDLGKDEQINIPYVEHRAWRQWKIE